MFFKKSLFIIFFLLGILFSATTESIFNPKIGVNADILVDGSLATQVDDRDFNYEQDFYIRSTEIIFSAAVDPFADFNLMLLFSEVGVELHDVSFVFSDVYGLKVKGGVFLANFGRWNQFHIHSMPFAVEPMIYKELNRGHLLLKGLEVSVIPFDFYLEMTFSIYHKLEGDSHDVLPFKEESVNDSVANQLGLLKHGDHWHDPKNPGLTYFASDLPILATSKGITYPGKPLLIINDITSWKNLTYGGRLKSIIEIGEDWSIDFGSSIVYRPSHFKSQIFENTTYFRSLVGGDITFFYHPLDKNAHQNIQFGVEWLANWQTMEKKIGDETESEIVFRQGVFCYCNFKVSSSISFGLNCSFVQKNQIDLQNIVTSGIFTTYNISHFQYLRTEYNYYSYPSSVGNLVAHRILLQYNVTIGYHSHGIQR